MLQDKSDNSDVTNADGTGRQRGIAERTAMSDAEQYETGLVVADELRHASRRKLTGSFAACGAGRIVVTLPSRFRREDPHACDDCARMLG